ncbi:MAG: hypothetical protein K6E29_06725 [Cyanobacteria bacterium RUI128]|nr:hypothetical protein [Cyanobacteria bacterium RUI128]
MSNLLIENEEILPCKSAQTLNKYKSVINNYAKSNNVQVRIFDPREMSKLMRPMMPGIELGGCVGVEVEPPFGVGKMKYGLINLFENGNKTPFIKRMYDKLAEMVEGKGNPFRRQQCDTILKLIQSGKIKA